MKRIPVRRIALKDIADYMQEQNIQIQDKNGDVWIVTATRMDCPEQRRLNIELGVSKVNYTKEIMSRNGKRKQN